MAAPSVAVLFVHGIQGQPRQLQFLMDALPEGVEARGILLPGHGTSAREFHRTGRKEWLAAVQAETEALRDRGLRVIYVGHSMGCLLGLRVSRALGHPYAGMLLLCCPFRVRLTGKLGDRWKAAGAPSEGEDPRITASREGKSVPVEGFADLLRILHPYAELLRLMGQVRRQKPKGPGSVCFFFSGSDEVVSLRSAKWAARWPDAKTQILDGCGHCYFTEAAKEGLRTALLRML